MGEAGDTEQRRIAGRLGGERQRILQRAHAGQRHRQVAPDRRIAGSAASARRRCAAAAAGSPARPARNAASSSKWRSSRPRRQCASTRLRAPAMVARAQLVQRGGWKGGLRHRRTHCIGRATSNATVNRSPAGNLRVPCHIVEGKRTSRPGRGATVRIGGRSIPSARASPEREPAGLAVAPRRSREARHRRPS